MKAIVIDGYGSSDDVLHLRDVDTPSIAADEVLVRVQASSLNPYDWHLMTGKPYIQRLQFGRRSPITGLGADLAGRVEAIGEAVTRFQPGDDVFGGVNGETPGHPTLDLGSCAEYAAVSQDWLALKPDNLTYEQAAAVPLAAITALQGFRDYGRVQPGHKVLVNGASGGVGTYAVQLAKALGAEVTGVCSTQNVEMVRSIGAAHVIDYTRQDVMQAEPPFDLVLDNVGNRPLTDWRRLLATTGIYLASFGQSDHTWLGPAAKLFRMMVYSRFVGQEMVLLSQHRKKEDIDEIRGFLIEGKVTPVIDRTYPLAATADALRYLEAGHARGKVVVTI